MESEMHLSLFKRPRVTSIHAWHVLMEASSVARPWKSKPISRMVR